MYENTLAQVRSGEIPQTRIDDAVRRILRVKALAGSFNRPAPKQRSDAVISRASQRGSSSAGARGCPQVPGAAQERPRHLAVESALENSGRGGCGGFHWCAVGRLDHRLQGDHNHNADFPGATSIYGASKPRWRPRRIGRTQQGWANGGKARRRHVVFGEEPYAEFEGDRENLEFSPNDRTIRAVAAVARRGVPTVAVFLSGRPLWVNPHINASDAFVAHGSPAAKARALRCPVRFAGQEHYDFTGRLAFSWPQTAMPVTFDAAGMYPRLFPAAQVLDYRSTGNSPQLRKIPEYRRNGAPRAQAYFMPGTSRRRGLFSSRTTARRFTSRRCGRIVPGAPSSPRPILTASPLIGRPDGAACSAFPGVRAICGRRQGRERPSTFAIVVDEPPSRRSRSACAAPSLSAARAVGQCWT